LSDREIGKIVEHWRAQASQKGHVAPVLNLGPVTGGFSSGPSQTPISSATQRPLFEGGEEDTDGDNIDDLFDEAVELVRGMEKASISLLQRHLRIGYTRAARLIDLMEERGVIGPHGAAASRVVLGPMTSTTLMRGYERQTNRLPIIFATTGTPPHRQKLLRSGPMGKWKGGRADELEVLVEYLYSNLSFASSIFLLEESRMRRNLLIVLGSSGVAIRVGVYLAMGGGGAPASACKLRTVM
jgi:hypothetical protein